MFKRSGEHLVHNNYKKPKANDDTEGLWGDDLDDKILDDCIKLATEVCEEENLSCTQRNNITLLPTYNAFKDRVGNVFSSTQLEASTSKISVTKTTTDLKIVELEKQINKLRRDCEVKEGEVTILREQLKDSKVVDEWRNKLSAAQKELKSVKSELEFKNLEILNLKQKLNDFKKASLENSLNSTSQHKFPSPKKLKTSVLQTTICNPILLSPPRLEYFKKIEPIVENVFPLKMPISSIISHEINEKHLIEIECTKLCRNTIPYLQNRVVLNEPDSDFHKCNIKGLNISKVLPDVQSLLNTSSEQLNSDNLKANINKLFEYLWELIVDLEDFLLKLSKNMKDEDIQRLDANYLTEMSPVVKNSPTLSLNTEEIGLKAAQALRILSEIILYNKYSVECLCDNSVYNEAHSSHYFSKENSQRRKLLLKLLDMIVIIRKYRKAKRTATFLSSTTKLITNLMKSKYFDYNSDGATIKINKIAHEIILARPNFDVISEFTKFLCITSQNSTFNEYLFNPNEIDVAMDTKNGVLHFSEGTCLFYIFSLMFENAVLKKNKLTVDMCMNMFTFMLNVYKENYWIFQRGKTDCDCLSHFHKLQIEIIHEALLKYESHKKINKEKNPWELLFEHGIGLDILNLMSFNNYDLIEKYITVFSQFKDVEHTMLQQKLMNEVEKLSITEDILPIPSASFSNIDF